MFNTIIRRSGRELACKEVGHLGVSAAKLTYAAREIDGFVTLLSASQADTTVGNNLSASPLHFRAKERQHVKYWIDTEFIERPFTIDLISVGLVAEDGREFYAESSEVDWSKASVWTLENVRPQLDGKGMTREEIGYALRAFTDGDEHPVFWGYFPAYDWVAFTWLFGQMDELPMHYPQLCLDIKQWAIELGDPELPHQVGARHHALADARWTKDAWAFLARLAPAAGERRAFGRKNPDQAGGQVKS